MTRTLKIPSKKGADTVLSYSVKTLGVITPQITSLHGNHLSRPTLAIFKNSCSLQLGDSGPHFMPADGWEGRLPARVTVFLCPGVREWRKGLPPSYAVDYSYTVLLLYTCG